MFPVIDFSKFISLSYWFETQPGEMSVGFQRLFLVILLFCYLMYAIAKIIIYRRSQQKNFVKVNFWRKVSSFWLSLAVVQTFLFFFRYEGIPILGGRFWFLIWLLMGLIWGGYLIYVFYKIIPEQMAQADTLKKFKEFLPKKKR